MSVRRIPLLVAAVATVLVPTHLVTGVSAASPTATVITRPRRSISRQTPRPSSAVSSPMARASSAVVAAPGGTRLR